MVSDKPRLYVTLYARSVPRTYHWALTLSPKHEHEDDTTETTRYHVRNLPADNGQVVWEYEQRATRGFATHQTLVRICITKIAPNAVSTMEGILKDVPIVQDDSDWNCRSWVKEALVALQEEGAIDRTFDVDDMEATAIWYVEKKISEGRFTVGYSGDSRLVPTWNLKDRKETQG